MSEHEVKKKRRYRHTGKQDCCPACAKMHEYMKYPTLREWLKEGDKDEA